MATTYLLSRVIWINRVRLPNLLVVSCKSTYLEVYMCWSVLLFVLVCILGTSIFFIWGHIFSVPASPDQGHDRLCRRGVGRVFLAGVRPDSPSRRRIPSCYRPGPGRGVVVELGQRGAH